MPGNAVVVSPAGTAIQNGAALRAALAALPVATADAPQAVVLGVGHFDAGSPTGFTVPAFVTLVGQGPHTVVENRSSNFQAVIALADGAVVRDMSVVNASGTVGAPGDRRRDQAQDTLVEGVTVEARTGILLRSATLRDASIEATTEGLRIAAPPANGAESEIDNVSIAVDGSPATIGVAIASIYASTASTRSSTAIPARPACGTPRPPARFACATRASGRSAPRPRSVSTSSRPAASSAVLVFDHSIADGGAPTSYGFRTDGSTSRDRIVRARRHHGRDPGGCRCAGALHRHARRRLCDRRVLLRRHRATRRARTDPKRPVLGDAGNALSAHVPSSSGTLPG